jgi:magnesium-transporting ATPase (P-type)
MTSGCRYAQPLAVVVTTGFATFKGDMLRRILHPVRHPLTFMRDALYFIMFMLVLGLAFYAWSIINLVNYNSEVRDCS